MSELLKSSKLFAAASILFALATLYNLNSVGAPGTPTRLTVTPTSQETIQSGPAVEPNAAQPARS